MPTLQGPHYKKGLSKERFGERNREERIIITGKVFIFMTVNQYMEQY